MCEICEDIQSGTLFCSEDLKSWTLPPKGPKYYFDNIIWVNQFGDFPSEQLSKNLPKRYCRINRFQPNFTLRNASPWNEEPTLKLGNQRRWNQEDLSLLRFVNCALYLKFFHKSSQGAWLPDFNWDLPLFFREEASEKKHSRRSLWFHRPCGISAPDEGTPRSAAANAEEHRTSLIRNFFEAVGFQKAELAGCGQGKAEVSKIAEKVLSWNFRNFYSRDTFFYEKTRGDMT